MNVNTSVGICIDNVAAQNYFKSLVGSFFKILPIKESGDDSLPTYLRSLQMEILGCKSILQFVENDGRILSLISILQYMIDSPECQTKDVRREVFRAISICNKLADKYSGCCEAPEVSV